MQGKSAYTLGFLAFSFFGACTRSEATDYAFLVAVQDYDVKQLTKLNYARNDILEFYQALLDSGYEADNVVLMHDDFSSLKSIRYAPLARNIRTELHLLLGTLEKEDSIIIGFAGHGVQFSGGDENYFCPIDADLSDGSRKSLISLKDIYSFLEKTKADKRLLLVDACRNDPQSQLSRSSGNQTVESISRPQLATPPTGVVALFSCAAGQQAYEWPEFQHGVFFYHVLEAWRNTNSELTLDQLIASTKSDTKEFARLKLGALQTPRQTGFFEGEWTFPRYLPVKQAIDRAISYLVSQQRVDGSWGSPEYGESTGLTSLAVMAFLTSGHVPNEGQFGGQLSRGINWVVAQQQPDGLLATKTVHHGPMYEHGISTLMLARVCNDVANQDLRPSLDAAVELIVRSQSVEKYDRHKGGWRYQPDSRDSDLSVTVWQVLALNAAKRVGCDVPVESIESALQYVQKCRVSGSGGFGYQPGNGATSTLTGAGISALAFCDNSHRKDAIGAANWLLENSLVNRSSYFFYGSYHSAIGMSKLGGKYSHYSREYLPVLLLPEQTEEGNWEPRSGNEKRAGNIYATSLAVLALATK